MDQLDETYSCILFGESNLRIKLSERPLLYTMCIQGSNIEVILPSDKLLHTNLTLQVAMCICSK